MKKRMMAGRLYQVDLQNAYGIIAADSGEMVRVEAIKIEGLVEFGRYFQFESIQAEKGWEVVNVLESFPRSVDVRKGKLLHVPTDDELGMLNTGEVNVLVSKRSFNLGGFTWLEVGHEYLFEVVPVGARRFRAARIISRTPLA